jgi:hypothetical protein
MDTITLTSSEEPPHRIIGAPRRIETIGKIGATKIPLDGLQHLILGGSLTNNLLGETANLSDMSEVSLVALRVSGRMNLSEQLRRRLNTHHH